MGKFIYFMSTETRLISKLMAISGNGYALTTLKQDCVYF